jgi:GNAT superfamily N-acetyltransferase
MTSHFWNAHILYFQTGGQPFGCMTTDQKKQMRMTTRIKRVVSKDAAALAELLLDIGWFAALHDKPIETVTAQVERQLAQCVADDSHSIYVAEFSADQIVGYSSVHWLPYLFMAGPEGYVSELFVRPSARGQGIGNELLRAVETEARARGCSRLSLINLRHRDSYLRKFYVKAGWEERTEAANFLYRIA